MLKPFELSTRQRLSQLYQNIGSTDRLLAILKAFYQSMSQDVMIGFFFDGKDTDQIAQQQSAFLLKAMGAQSEYTGKAPGRAHDQIAPILPGHFDRRMVILEQTLKQQGLSAEDIRTWIDFEKAFRDAVISKE